jgi:hypothetical protein
MAVKVYVGGPGTGKTHAAFVGAVAESRETGRPLLIVDSAGVENFDAHFPVVVTDVTQAIDAVWVDGAHVRYIPEDEDDVSKVWAAARAGQDVIVLVDEVSFWCESGRSPKELSKLTRTYRHARASLYFTSQYPADFPRWLKNCATDAFIFRCEDSRALETIEGQWKFPAEQVAALPDRYFLEWHYGQAVGVVGAGKAGRVSDVAGTGEAGKAGEAGLHPGAAPEDVEGIESGGVDDDDNETGKGGEA